MLGCLNTHTSAAQLLPTLTTNIIATTMSHALNECIDESTALQNLARYECLLLILRIHVIIPR